MPRRLPASLFLCLVCSLGTPGIASAQWYVAGYLGGNHTHDAAVSIRVPSENLAVDFHDVRFAAEPTVPRRYYGLRIGRMFGGRRLGLELELIHMKAIGDTDRTYDVTVQPGSTPPPGGAAPMNLVVSEYRMTHGLNLCFVNAVFRQTLGGSDSVSLMLRGGGGPTFPHAETTVLGRVKHGYEYAGFGAQGAAGIEIRLPYRLSVVTEYKLTYARPKISLADGTASMTAVTHHVVAGMAYQVTK